MKKRLLSLALVTAVMMAMMPVSILADGVSVMEDPKPGYLTPQNSERRMAPVFLRQIEISYYS